MRSRIMKDISYCVRKKYENILFQIYLSEI